MNTSKRAGRSQYLVQRDGYMYIVVLGLSTIVSIMAISTMTIARTEIRSSAGASDWQGARNLALSAIEAGMATINSDDSWRTNLVNGQFYPGSSGVSFSNGKMKWKLEDTDGKLGDSNSDPVRVYGYGYVGDAVYAQSVLVHPTGAALSCLQNSLHAGGSLQIDNSTVSTSQTLSTNADAIAVNGASVFGKVEAVGSISGDTYNGELATNAPARQMPDSNSVFDFYISRGTAINIWPLPWEGSSAIMEKFVLSPQNNPFGGLNPEGVYVIDCDGWTIKIRDCRIVGTLVLLDPGSGSVIENSVCMEPAIEYYPTLLVDGDFKIGFSQNELRELTLLKNLNPSGTPFPYLGGTGTNTDADVFDSYPSQITGLVYIAQALAFSAGAPTIHGCVISGGACDVTSTDLTLQYRQTWLDFPPPGFTTGDRMAIAPGTWIRESSEP